MFLENNSFLFVAPENTKSECPRVTVLRSGREPVRPFGYEHLEPRPFALLPGLTDRYPGDREHFTGEVESKTCMFPVPAFEDLHLFFRRDADTVVFHNQDNTVRHFTVIESDFRYRFSVKEGIFHKVEKDFLKKGIGKDLKILETDLPRYVQGIEMGDGVEKDLVDVLPAGRVDPQVPDSSSQNSGS